MQERRTVSYLSENKHSESLNWILILKSRMITSLISLQESKVENTFSPLPSNQWLAEPYGKAYFCIPIPSNCTCLQNPFGMTAEKTRIYQGPSDFILSAPEILGCDQQGNLHPRTNVCIIKTESIRAGLSRSSFLEEVRSFQLFWQIVLLHRFLVHGVIFIAFTIAQVLHESCWGISQVQRNRW